MPWRNDSTMGQRSQFILEIASGDSSLSELCRKYGISRPTGYKWKKRFKREGLAGLRDRSRRPLTTKQVPHVITTRIVAYRQAHGSWGATKIRKILLREFKRVPSRRTIHRILQDCNFVTTRRRQRGRKVPTRIVLKALYCNHVWTVDFKGWWRTKDGKKVYPLTIRDEYSRMILAIEICQRPTLELVKAAFIRCFEQYGLPEYIRSDNGAPFANSTGLCGLSRLSAWWLRLGIVPNFIPPASPQFNGAHERMHRDMKADMQVTPARNAAMQQVVADEWRREFNTIRPHDALNDRTPSQVYRPSTTKYNRAEHQLEYPARMLKRFVNKQGKFRFEGKRYFITKAVGGDNVGLEFTPDGFVDVWYGTTRLARWDAGFTAPVTEYNLISGELFGTQAAA